MKKVNRVGEKYFTNQGYEVEIIEYFGASNCTIKFNNGFTIKNRVYQHVKEGRIKNPYHKSVFGVGFVGLGIYSRGSYSKIYNVWNGILRRCYDAILQERYPTYKGCCVAEEWKCFQNFASWLEDNWRPWMGNFWDLDKDILFKGNKIYSPETCCFVPHEINNLFTKCNSARGKYPIGVSKVGNKFKAELNTNIKSIHLGYFFTPEEAFKAYKTAKETYIKEVADKWRDQITELTYWALINYKVEITD